MNLDHSICTSNNEGESEIKSSTHLLKQDDHYNTIGTDNVKNPPQTCRCQCGPLDKATCANSTTSEDSQVIGSVLIMFQDFYAISSNNWRCEDENSGHFSFADRRTFLHDEDNEERGKDETDDKEDEDSICDSIGVTVRRRLKQNTMPSSDNDRLGNT